MVIISIKHQAGPNKENKAKIYPVKENHFFLLLNVPSSSQKTICQKITGFKLSFQH